VPGYGASRGRGSRASRPTPARAAPQAFARAWVAGEAMTLEEAIADGLTDEPPAHHPAHT
jgi:hypothetical protein